MDRQQLQGNEVVSENFYLRGVEEENFRALRELPKVKLGIGTEVEKQGTHWVLTSHLSNPSNQPALMVRVKAVRENSGDRILTAHLQRQLYRPDARRSLNDSYGIKRCRHLRRGSQNCSRGFNVQEATEK
jgi:Ig-like domain-containing protein